MKLTIFGATGRTGAPLVRGALAAGFEVVAFVRSPEKLSEQQGEHERLRVVQGGVPDAAKVGEAVKGADAVVSVLGPSQNTPDYQVSRGTQHIVAAMKEHGVRRLVISVGLGVASEGDAPKLVNHVISFILKVAAKHVLEDMTRTVALVRASDLDWTVMRVPMLTDGPATGKVRVGMVGRDAGSRISREDMADFMLKQVTDTAHLRQSPVIST